MSDLKPPPAEILRIEDVVKVFGGARALDGASLIVRAGEAHGLLGQNGSGKSTLIKVLAGYHAPEQGSLAFHGEPIELPLVPGQLSKLGLGIVHQDLGLVGSLSVLENLRVHALVKPASGLRIRWGAERRLGREMLGRYGLDYDVGARVDQLRPGERAQLALVRAVEGLRREGDGGSPAGLLILDEITAFLTHAEVQSLFALVRRIAAEGAGVLIVSHDLDEVFEITDRVTVLRDGRTVAELETAKADETQMVSLIVGRELKRDLQRPAALPPGDVPPILTVRDLRRRNLRVPQLDARPGEIVGATGLLGSGFDDLVYALFGAVAGSEGTIGVDGREYDLARLDPPTAMSAGIGLIPADRASGGSMPNLPVADNVTALVLDRYARAGTLSRAGLRQNSERVVDEFDVQPRDPTLPYGVLSGGNQQKALLAKWLEIAPKVLLLHEPTQGVDVGAREQVFELLRATAARGGTIVCASADHDQLARICHRVLVLHRGTIVQELSGDAVTVSAIGEACMFGQRIAGGTTTESEKEAKTL